MHLASVSNTLGHMRNTEAPQGVADRVLRIVKDDERSLEWLSRKSGIPYSTLRAHLIYKPHRLTIDTAGKIANALGRPLTDLVAS